VEELNFFVSDGPKELPSCSGTYLNEPVLDEHLVAALLNLPWLQNLWLSVRSGSLLPQLGSLAKISSFTVKHSCLQGSLPQTLLTSWTNVTDIKIIQAEDLTCSDSSNNEPCGISGTLPAHLPESHVSNLRLMVADGRLTGRLPLDLLSWGDQIILFNNQLTGPIPGATTNIKAQHLDLSNNMLEVSAGP
jgi:hypothetical protein